MPRSFLIIRPGGIGDAVHLLPLLQQLRNCFPTAEITLLAERRNAGVFDLSPVEVTVLCYDRPVEFYNALFSHYDVVIDSEQWHRLSAFVAWLVRAPVKIGFASNERKRLFTDSLPYTHNDYEAEIFLSLLAPLAIPFESLPAPPWLQIPLKTYKSVAKLQERINGSYVVIFPGASIAERRWGEECFSLLSRTINESGWKVIVVGGCEDCATAAAICRDSGAHDFSGKTTLAETAALIAGADLLVSGDSGILHISMALGISTVSLFGSGIAKKWAPRGERHSVLNLNLPCAPCTLFGTTPPCTKNMMCMSGISVDAVFNAVKKQMELNGINRWPLL